MSNPSESNQQVDRNIDEYIFQCLSIIFLDFMVQGKVFGVMDIIEDPEERINYPKGPESGEERIIKIMSNHPVFTSDPKPRPIHDLEKLTYLVTRGRNVGIFDTVDEFWDAVSCYEDARFSLCLNKAQATSIFSNPNLNSKPPIIKQFYVAIGKNKVVYDLPDTDFMAFDSLDAAKKYTRKKN